MTAPIAASGVLGWVLLSVRLPVPPRFAVSLFFQCFTYKEGFGFAFSGGALAPLLGVFSFVFSELSTGSSLLLLVLYYLYGYAFWSYFKWGGVCVLVVLERQGGMRFGRG